jgi:RNA polymerase sigma-70 factor (ECF subfamily)
MTTLAASDQADARRRDTSAHNPRQRFDESTVGTDVGEECSWDAIVRTHSARVYRLAYRLTGNQHDAEDLTQDVFIRVFKSLQTYTPGAFEGWLHRITTNLFLDDIRRTTRLQTVAVHRHGDELASHEPSPDQVLADRQLDTDVQTALSALPADFRITVVLCDIEGLGHEQIAEILGIRLGTVRSRLHRGRAQLRAILAERAPRPCATIRLTPARGTET